jgi:hypothetical protein
LLSPIKEALQPMPGHGLVSAVLQKNHFASRTDRETAGDRIHNQQNVAPAKLCRAFSVTTQYPRSAHAPGTGSASLAQKTAHAGNSARGLPLKKVYLPKILEGAKRQAMRRGSECHRHGSLD